MTAARRSARCPSRSRPAATRFCRARAAALPARVLVADDNADMRDYLARLLRAAGYQVTAVTDGQAALDAVRVGMPPTW